MFSGPQPLSTRLVHLLGPRVPAPEGEPEAASTFCEAAGGSGTLSFFFFHVHKKRGQFLPHLPQGITGSLKYQYRWKEDVKESCSRRGLLLMTIPYFVASLDAT